jgi:hypothetical protein
MKVLLEIFFLFLSYRIVQGSLRFLETADGFARNKDSKKPNNYIYVELNLSPMILKKKQDHNIFKSGLA